MWAVIHGDCVEEISKLEDGCFDSIVTDPPYALDFMGKDWDSFGDGKGFQAWCEEWARECLRVLKPGGHMLAFGGTRTYHRLVCAIEDAGFEIRDSIHWFYGSGFPKSLNVSKAIDKEAGVEREIVGQWNKPGRGKRSTEQKYGLISNSGNITSPATDAAKQWDGWGTALKPAHEPIVMARKPLAAKHTVASNVLEYGTGALNVDGCLIDNYGETGGTEGRWPANLVFSHSPECAGDCADDCPVAELDRQSGVTGPSLITKPADATPDHRVAFGKMGAPRGERGYAGSGGASRFFYCAKAGKKERPVVEGITGHPTVKPLALIRYLVRLVTPLGGTVLDLFGGSGTTAEACEIEGFNSVLVERDPDSIRRIEARMADRTFPHMLEIASTILQDECDPGFENYLREL